MADFCPHCADWPIAPSDTFCGGCRAFVGPVKVTLVERPTSKGVTTCLQVEAARADLRKVAFAVVDAASVEIARAQPGEFPEGLLVPLPQRRDYGLSVQAVAASDDGRIEFAPNVLAMAVVQRGGATSPPSLHLCDPAIDFAAARPERPGWQALPVELVNTGPPVVLAGARLRVDGEPTGDEDPDDRPDPPRVLLREGERAVFEAWISQQELDGLTGSSRPRTGTVDLTAYWLDGGSRRVTVAGRANLYRAREADMQVDLAWRIRGRAGEAARVGALIVNSGGTALRIERIEFAFEGAALATPMPLEWRRTLAPGEEAQAELRPVFPGPAGLRKKVVLTVTAVAENSADPIERQVSRSAEVTPSDSVFRGRLCIDFGTSESGAAARLSQTDQPIIIDLGRVPLQQQPNAQQYRDRLGRFLPTVVAEMEDGSFLTGGDAAYLVRAEELASKGHAWPDDLERPKNLAVEFKWTLDSGQSDGGARGELLAAAYLKTIRGLIENHPEIAAAIDTSTPVVATRPTVFDDGRSERLVKAFTAAGFGDPRVSLPSGERTLVAESWAPLPFVLQGEEASADAMLPLDRELTLTPILEPYHPQRAGASAWLLVCDVGAGSADFSVVEIIPERGVQLLREQDSHTDLNFVGRHFRELIGSVLLEWATGQWTAQGHPTVDRLQFALAIGAREDSTATSRAAFERALRALQYEPGLLTGGTLPGDLLAAIRKSSEEPAAVAVAVSKAFGPAGEARKAARLYLPIELEAPNGRTIVIDTDNVASLVEQLVMRFLAVHRAPLERMIGDLLDRSGLSAYVADRDSLVAGREGMAAAEHVRIVPSGRGAAFVPAKSLLRAAVASLTSKGATFTMLSPVASKSITSWGGLKIADAIERKLSAYRIDLGGRPLRPRVKIGENMNGAPITLEMEINAEGAFLDLASIAEQHVDIDRAETLEVRTGPEDDAGEHEVPLDSPQVANPAGWWLCAVRHGARVVVEIVEGATGPEALATLRTQEERSA